MGLDNDNDPVCKSIVYNCETRTCNAYCADDTEGGQLAEDGPSIYLRYSIENCPFTQSQAAVSTTSSGPVTGCPSGQTPKIVMVDNYLYPGLHSDKELHVESKEECGTACLLNQLSDGTPIDCHSAQYHANQCILSSTQALAQDVPLQKDQSATFFQKFCFDSKLVANCEDFMEEYPQKALIGQNKQTIDATSVEDCFMHCLNAQKDFGFLCESGLFFATVNTQNCILNTESKEDHPELFTDLKDDTAFYFEPKCGGGDGGSGGGGLQSTPVNASPSPPTPPTPRRGGPVRRASPPPVTTSTNSIEESSVAITTTVAGSTIKQKRQRNRLRTKAPARFELVLSSQVEWSPWSSCGDSNIQFRYKLCNETDPSQCQRQVRPCGNVTTSTPSPIGNSHIKSGTNSNQVNSMESDGAKKADAPFSAHDQASCLAFVDNAGRKNCRIGRRTVEGGTRWCANPVNC